MDLRVPKRFVPLVSWLNRSGQFKIRAGRRGQVVLSDQVPVATWPVTDSAPAALAATKRPSFVIAHRLTTKERALLEERGIPYADAAGHLFIKEGPVLLRVDDPTLRRAPLRPETNIGIGYAGVRIAQELFASPDREWTVSAVQTAAAVSKGRASQVLQLLDREGMTIKQGSGRRVREPAALLDWLAGQPKARQSRPRLECAVYAQDAADAAARVQVRLGEAGIGFALTGSVAARSRGMRVVTSQAVWVRVDSNIPLAHASEQLNGTAVRTGGNVVLVRDTGHLGYVGGAYPIGNEQAAGEARIYLDLFAEPRGESAAELFRDLLLGNG